MSTQNLQLKLIVCICVIILTVQVPQLVKAGTLTDYDQPSDSTSGPMRTRDGLSYSDYKETVGRGEKKCPEINCEVHCPVPSNYFRNQGQFCTSHFAYWLGPTYCKLSLDYAILSHLKNLLFLEINAVEIKRLTAQVIELSEEITKVWIGYRVIHRLEYIFISTPFGIGLLVLIFLRIKSWIGKCRK